MGLKQPANVQKSAVSGFQRCKLLNVAFEQKVSLMVKFYSVQL